MSKGKYKPYPKHRCRKCGKMIYRGGHHTVLGDHYHKACWDKLMHEKNG